MLSRSSPTPGTRCCITASWVGDDSDASHCFDVTDDQDYQVYRAGSATARTTSVVQQTWPVAARKAGDILETRYQDNLSTVHTDSCGEAADGVRMSQNGTQACNEANTGNKYNVILAKYYYPGLQLSTAQQLRAQHDFRFLAGSSRVTFNAGKWAIDDGYPTTFNYGESGDQPTVTNNGDGFAHVGVFRPSTSTWYVAGPTGATVRKTHFGLKGDVPVQAQYNGVDQPTVLAVFRPSTNYWYLANTNGSVASQVHYGLKGDIPVPGHYFGSSADHYADTIAVFRPSEGRWYVRGHSSVQWGRKGDIPVPADYNGDGTTDLAVYRPSDHRFYVRGQASVEYGITGDIPVTGDFTGDGKADLAVYRPSTHTWYVRGSSTHVWGSSGATPVGRAPVPRLTVRPLRTGIPSGRTREEAMRGRPSGLRRGVAALAGLLLSLVLTSGVAAAGPNGSAAATAGTPGGLTPQGARTARAMVATGGFGDCAVRGVTCKPSGTAKPSCTGYTSQTTAPATIRVLVRTSSTAVAHPVGRLPDLRRERAAQRVGVELGRGRAQGRGRGGQVLRLVLGDPLRRISQRQADQLLRRHRRHQLPGLQGRFGAAADERPR